MEDLSRELDPEWLTRALQGSGALTRGSVIAVDARSNPAFNSRALHLRLTYSQDAEGGPSALFLKLKKDQEGRDEVAFYRLPESGRLAVIPRCYRAEHVEESGRSILLLHDYSETHQPALAPGAYRSRTSVPEPAQLDRIIDALAELHAAFWEDPRLGGSEAPFQASTWWRDDSHFEALLDRWTKGWIDFESREKEWLPRDIKDVYRGALDALPQLWSRRIRPRLEGLKGITLIHGDCYFGQFLVPTGNGEERALLVDLESACAGFGALDLVYLMATFWNPAQRHRGGRERRLLQRYQESLERNLRAREERSIAPAGVYGWSELVADYRLMLSLALFTPIWDYSYQGADDTYWWTKLQCLLAAYRDWECDRLSDAR